MRKIFRRIPFKKILLFTLTSVLLLGGIVSITSAVKNDKTAVSSLVFKRGAIDSKGAFVESDTSIYTADYIECQGLRIEPDFEATGTYQVFYYDSNKNLLGATEIMKTSETPVYEKGSSFAVAKYCKIVITPDTPMDDEGMLVDDYKIKFYEVAGIAGKFTIAVSKNQSYAWTDVYVADESMVGKYYGNSLSDISEMASYIPSEVFDLKGFKEIVVVVNNFDQTDALAQLCFIDSNGSFVKTINFESGNIKYESDLVYCIVTIPEGVSSAVLNGVYNNNYCIYVR